MLSITGRSATDVWSVGADKGQGPAVLHYDGTRWTRLATGQRGHLWWVHVFNDGTAMMGGASGMILRYDGTTFTAHGDARPGPSHGLRPLGRKPERCLRGRRRIESRRLHLALRRHRVERRARPARHPASLASMWLATTTPPTFPASSRCGATALAMCGSWVGRTRSCVGR